MDDVVRGDSKRNFFVKAWERCRSLGAGTSKSPRSSLKKSKSWPNEEGAEISKQKKNKKGRVQVGPEGCFSVYVGPEKQRFVVRTELANHPLFKMLLEDAEKEYGFSSNGPLLLPCDVGLFYRVLAEIESGGGGGDDDDDDWVPAAPSWSPMVLCSPHRRNCRSNKDYGNGVYRLLNPSRVLRLN